MSAADNVNVKSYTWTNPPTVLNPPSGDLASDPETVKGVSPLDEGVTVKVEETPAMVGVTVAGEKVLGRPVSVRDMDGIVPVEPAIRVAVTVYLPPPPSSNVSGGVIARVKS